MNNPTRWATAAGFPNYEVSTGGQVRRSKPGLGTHAGKILRTYEDKGGYRILRPYIDGKAYNASVHRLVALTFLGDPLPGQEVCHNDGNPANNRLENPRWGSKSANTQDAVKHGTNFYARKTHCPEGHTYDEANTRIDPATGARSCRRCKAEHGKAKRIIERQISGPPPAPRPKRGTEHHHAKLDEEQVRMIRNRADSGEYQHVIAKDYGVSKGAISLIARRKNWAWVI